MELIFRLVSKKTRTVLFVVGLTSLFFGAWLVFATRLQTNAWDLIYKRYLAPLLYVEDNMGEAPGLHVTVEARDGNALSLSSLREQDSFFAAVEERWPVKIESLSAAIDSYLATGNTGNSEFRVKDIVLPDSLQRMVFTLYKNDTYEFERFARKGLSSQGALDTLASFNYFFYKYPGLTPDPDDLPTAQALRATIVVQGDLSEAQVAKIYDEIRRLAGEYATVNQWRFYALPLLVYDIDIHVKRNALWVAAVMVLLIATVLFVTFRSKYFVVLPLLVLGLTLLWSYGLTSLLMGRQLSFLAVIPIPLLLGQTIDNLIHFNERFREEFGQLDKWSALQKVFRTAGRAALLTTSINVLAFTVDFFTSGLRPIREYALLLVLGIGLALLLTYLVESAFVLLLRMERPKTSRARSSRTYHLGKYIFYRLQAGRWLVWAGGLLVLVALVINLGRLDRTHRPSTYMARAFPTKEAYEFEKENFELYEPHYVLIQGDALSEKTSELIVALENKLESMADVEHIREKLNRESLSYLTEKFSKLPVPEDRGEFFEKLSSSGAIINSVTSETVSQLFKRLVYQKDERYEATLIKFWPKLSDSNRIKEINRELLEVAKPFEPDLKTSLAGEFLGFSLTVDGSMRDATIASFAIGLIILVLLSLAYRSFKTGLIAIVPLVFGTAMGLGSLPLLHIELTPLNATVTVLALGLGVDYAIQIMARYREELRQQEREKAMAEAFGHMLLPLGQAMLLTCAGLIVLTGLLPLTGKFGIAGSLAILAGYLAAVTVMPLLAVRFVKR